MLTLEGKYPPKCENQKKGSDTTYSILRRCKVLNLVKLALLVWTFACNNEKNSTNLGGRYLPRYAPPQKHPPMLVTILHRYSVESLMKIGSLVWTSTSSKKTAIFRHPSGGSTPLNAKMKKNGWLCFRQSQVDVRCQVW